MSKKQEWRDYETLPAIWVPKDMRRSGAYQSSGFRCRVCPWKTDKVGYSGRQAVRAHSRVHAYEKRSWRRPLARTIAVLVATGIVAVLGYVGLVQFRPILEVTVPQPALIAFLLAPTALASCVIAAVSRRGEPSPRLVWMLRAVGIVVFMPGLFIVFAEIGLIDTEVGPVQIALATAASAAMAVTFMLAGGARLLVRRRDRVPKGYVEFATARDDDAEDDLRNWVRERQQRAAKRAEAGRLDGSRATQRKGAQRVREQPDRHMDQR